jgi:xanthine dehydrogenase YagR molybdenum-binding subunit
MALRGTVIDHRFGRHECQHRRKYHVPVNADVQDIKVIFVDEQDNIINPLGIRVWGGRHRRGPAAIPTRSITRPESACASAVTLDKLGRAS